MAKRNTTKPPRRMRRSEREALAAAAAVFRSAGLDFHEDVGGKHKLLVVTLPGGGEFRFPLSNSPSGGVESGANIARWNAQKLVRRLGAA